MKILLAGTIADWNSLDLSRADQSHRNALAKALNEIANSISNNGTASGGIRWPGVTLNFRLEVEPVAETDDAAA
jgi:hypothetical protein